jgi:hypothetical protein
MLLLTGSSDERSPNQKMHNNSYSAILLPLLRWLATVFVVVTAYLGSLYFEEKRVLRRLKAERQRLGVKRV